jgi:thymidine kinase
MNPNAAYLEIILGCMYSGKSSKLINIYKQCKFCNINVLVINHSLDTRYDDKMLSTHDKQMIPCVQATRIADTKWNEMGSSVSTILINEAQFFDDLYDEVLAMLKEKKHVYICGLDGDFERNKFGQTLDLIPHCDKVTKLTSLCGICKNGTSALFSLRITEDKTQTLVGTDNYIPVCRECYEEPK